MDLGGVDSPTLSAGPRPVVDTSQLQTLLQKIRDALPHCIKPDFQQRVTWFNNNRNQQVDPLRVYNPTSIAQQQEIVRQAEAEETTVRAVGSGHSWSDVALGQGFLVQPQGLSSALDLEPELMLERPQDAPALVRIESGMTIADLNQYLANRGLALPNMGGFDGQTIVGATQTSTHGSGIAFGPLSDLIQSLDVVGSGGTVYRIERATGPTNPAAYTTKHPDRTLVKDDDWFRAAVVGMGSMGLVHSVIVETRPAFHLREVRTMSTWSQVRRDLDSGVLQRNAHYEVLFSPYPRDDGELECLVTTRNEVTPDQYRHDFRRTRNWLVELAARFWFTPKIIDFVVWLWPQLSPTLLHLSMTGLVNPDYVNVSYNVFNIGAANYLPAYSAEIGVPIDQRGLHLDAVDQIVKVAARHRNLGNTYQSAPISLRFVRGTDSYLSMMEGRDTMMIELIMLDHSKGGMELQTDYENALYDHNEGRSHWGQVNHLSRERVENLYPHFNDWLRIHSELNKSGVFDSLFTQRVGISG